MVALAAPRAGRGIVSLKQHLMQGNVFFASVAQIRSLPQGNVTTSDIKWESIAKGQTDFALLGASLAMFDQKTVIMGSPQISHETGAIHGWRDRKTLWGYFGQGISSFCLSFDP